VDRFQKSLLLLQLALCGAPQQTAPLFAHLIGAPQDRSKSSRRPAMRARNKMQGMRVATEWVRPLFKRLYEKAFAVLAIPDQQRRPNHRYGFA
jgi:hypothetical protein